jgi:hypothetical protein
MMASISLEASRAFSERYRVLRALSATINPLPDIDRPTPVLRYEAPECDRRLAAPSRDPCLRCNVRGDLGCEHQAPFVPQELAPARLNILGHRIHARHSV